MTVDIVWGDLQVCLTVEGSYSPDVMNDLVARACATFALVYRTTTTEPVAATDADE